MYIKSEVNTTYVFLDVKTNVDRQTDRHDRHDRQTDMTDRQTDRQTDIINT